MPQATQPKHQTPAEYDPVQTAREWFEDTLADRPEGSADAEAAIKAVDAVPGSARGKVCKAIHDEFKANGGKFEEAVVKHAGAATSATKDHATKAASLGLSEDLYDDDTDE
jgi:acyl-CoA reductase-like NAD-dependent aldehyde dehydrogenase